jgi:prophage regulatory protein
MDNQDKPKKKVLRRHKLQAHTGLSLSSLYNKLNKNSPYYDPTFPKPIKLGPKAVGWLESEIDAWLESRMASR